MSGLISTTKGLLRPLKRRVNQWRGLDLPYRAEHRCNKVRLGSLYGGWAFCPDGLTASSVVYSFGVGNDISFDLAIIERFGVSVHAFDPTPKCMQWIRSQKLPPEFVFHEQGLADYDGVARFVLPRADNVSYAITGRSSPATGADIVECQVRKLATFCRELGHDHIDILKMDIEGAEYAAVPDILASGIPVGQLLVEVHHAIGDRPSLQQSRTVIESLRHAGYRIFDVSPAGFEYSFIHSATGQ